MTNAQRRLVDSLKAQDGSAEYWPLMNDWVKDKGPAQALAFRNITRTVDALIRAKVITLTDDGLIELVNRS